MKKIIVISTLLLMIMVYVLASSTVFGQSGEIIPKWVHRGVYFTYVVKIYTEVVTNETIEETFPECYHLCTLLNGSIKAVIKYEITHYNDYEFILARKILKINTTPIYIYLEGSPLMKYLDLLSEGERNTLRLRSGIDLLAFEWIYSYKNINFKTVKANDTVLPWIKDVYIYLSPDNGKFNIKLVRSQKTKWSIDGERVSFKNDLEINYDTYTGFLENLSYTATVNLGGKPCLNIHYFIYLNETNVVKPYLTVNINPGEQGDAILIAFIVGFIAVSIIVIRLYKH